MTFAALRSRWCREETGCFSKGKIGRGWLILVYVRNRGMRLMRSSRFAQVPVAVAVARSGGLLRRNSLIERCDR